MTYVALLRGVNVGGKNKLPMKQLAAVLPGIGCQEVRTFIQSGNVVFRSATQKRDRPWADEIADAIQKSFGLKVPVVVRTADEMQNLLAENEFASTGANPDFLHVVFLSRHPGKLARGEEKEQRFAPETFRQSGVELYLFTPNGLGRSKLAADLERRLKAAGVIGTTRNWRTTVELAQMARALQQL